MKILICLSYYYPNISGLTLYAKTLAEELVTNGNEVILITSHHEKSLPSTEIIHGVKVIRLRTLGIVKKVPVMPDLLLQIIPYILWADVVNCHLPQLESLPISLLARFFGKPFVATYQTDLEIRAAHYLHRIPLFLADSVIALSEDYAKHSKTLPYFSKKLHYIFPPIYFPKPTEKSIQNMKKRINAQGKYVIGFVGRISSEKGIEYLLHAIQFLETYLSGKFLIVLAGPIPVGEKKYQHIIHALLTQYKDYVISLGQITQENLEGFYRNIDVLVLPSINTTEALGIVQIEAMLSGIPVVVSDLPGVRVPVQITGMGKIIKPKDSHAIAEGVKDVLEHKKKYIKDRKIIEDIFSLQKSISSYENLFKKLAEK